MSDMKTFNRVVFCDFDGTITSIETFVGMFKELVPGLYEDIGGKMRDMEITIREGVRQIVNSMPASRYPEMLAYVRDKNIRPGFVDLLDFLDERNVPMVVISGGLVGMVRERLGPLAQRVHAIHAADVDTSGEFLSIWSDFEEGSELVAKARIMELYAADERVAIGDGPTDLNMAQHATTVFARGMLAQFLNGMNIEYHLWEDFFDVRKRLEALWDRA